MSVIWSGITEQGAVVPVQVDASGKVIATASVPDEYVLRSGDTMTGPLVLPSDPTQSLQAATKQYVDTKINLGYFAAAKVSAIGSPVSAYNAQISSDRLGVYTLEFFQRPSNDNYIIQITPDFRPNRVVTVATYESGASDLTGFQYYLNDITSGLSQANDHSIVVFAMP